MTAQIDTSPEAFRATLGAVVAESGRNHRVLFRLGVPLETLIAWDSDARAHDNGADKVMTQLGFEQTVSQAARKAQRIQDQGGTWGRALNVYDEAMKVHDDEAMADG